MEPQAAQVMRDRSPIRTDLPCVGCGYNLRTMPMGGRCPECGLDVASSAFAPGARLASTPWLRTVRLGAAILFVSAVALCAAAAFTELRLIALTGPAGARWTMLSIFLLERDFGSDERAPWLWLAVAAMFVRSAALVLLCVRTSDAESRAGAPLWRLEVAIPCVNAFVVLVVAVEGSAENAFLGFLMLIAMPCELAALVLFHSKVRELAVGVASQPAIALAWWGTVGHAAAPLAALVTFIVSRQREADLWLVVGGGVAAFGSLFLILALAVIAAAAERELARRRDARNADFSPETRRSGG